MSFCAKSQMVLKNSQVAIFVGSTYSVPAVIATPKTISGKLPLIISCHGSGEQGTDTVSLYNNGLPATLKAGFKPPFDFIMVAPQRSSYGVDPNWLYGIISDMEKRYQIDSSRIYITGYSAGGWACYGSQTNIDTTLGKMFAAIAILSGATQDINTANYSWYGITKTPVWAVTGSADISYAAQNLNVSNNINAIVPNLDQNYTRQGLGHCCFTDIYDTIYRDPHGKTIWDFLYSNKRVLSSTHPQICNTNPPQKYILSLTDPANQEFYFVQQKNWKGGDTLVIPPGNYSGLIGFLNINGDPCNPIVITGYGVTNNSAIRFSNDSYIHAMGFKTTKGLSVSICNHMDIDGNDISNSGGVGIWCKVNPDSSDTRTIYPNYVMNKIRIRNNYVHNTGSEGMYVGNCCPSGGDDNKFIVPVRLDSIRIDHNRVDSTYWDGIQLSNALNGCYIDSNNVSHYGLGNASEQQAGIIIGSNTTGDIFGNTIKSGTGNGIQSFSDSICNIHDNLMDSAGTSPNQNCIFTNHYKSGPEVRAPQQLNIYNNTFTHLFNQGIVVTNNYQTLATNAYNNNFCLPVSSGNWQAQEIILNPAGSLQYNNVNICPPIVLELPTGGYSHLVIPVIEQEFTFDEINKKITIKSKVLSTYGIFDMAGRKLKSSILVIGSNNIYFNYLPKGTYFIRYNKVIVKMFVLK